VKFFFAERNIYKNKYLKVRQVFQKKRAKVWNLFVFSKKYTDFCKPGISEDDAITIRALLSRIQSLLSVEEIIEQCTLIAGEFLEPIASKI